MKVPRPETPRATAMKGKTHPEVEDLPEDVLRRVIESKGVP